MALILLSKDAMKWFVHGLIFCNVLVSSIGFAANHCEDLFTSQKPPSRLETLLDNKDFTDRILKTNDVYWNSLIATIANLRSGESRAIVPKNRDKRDLVMTISHDEVRGVLKVRVEYFRLSHLRIRENADGISRDFIRLVVSIAEGVQQLRNQGLDIRTIELVGGSVVNKKLIKSLVELGFQRNRFKDFFTSYAYKLGGANLILTIEPPRR